MPDYIWIENVLFPLVGMGMGVLFMFGVYRTINRVLDRRHERQLALMQGSGAEVRALVQRLEAAEDQLLRIPELEERIDFTERLLARQKERDRLAPGS
jgi:hypothetical protein